MINHITIIGKGRVGVSIAEVLGTRYERQVLGTGYEVLGTGYEVLGTGYEVLGTESSSVIPAKAGIQTLHSISSREFVGTSVPGTSVPSTSVPSTSVPSTSVPSTSVPSTSVPSTSSSLFLLACKDAYLPDVINRLAEQYGATLAGSLVLHVNGSLGTDILQPVRAHGALVSAAHPFQTFGSSDPSALTGIGWGVDCEDDAWPLTEEFVKLVGGLPFRLTKTDAVSKRRYHAAAVAASNFTYAAYDLARELAREVGIPEEAFLIPIMQRTLDNAAEAMRNGTSFALTGPLVRGDVEAVQRQLDAMPAHLREQYVYLTNALKEVIGR